MMKERAAKDCPQGDQRESQRFHNAALSAKQN